MEVKLVVIGGKNEGREIPVTENEFIIGRGEDCHLRPASDRVSRKHCAIRREEGRATITDFKSTNHTYVNGEEVTGERELKNGDRLKIGNLEFEVQLAVSVGGSKKPKVNSIQEAAARTVQNTASKDDDLDITSWLEDDEQEESIEEIRSADTRTINDTQTTHKLTDTTTIHQPHKEIAKEKKEEKKLNKGPGHFEVPKKPKTQDSQTAANDMLRQLFGRKK